MYSYIISDLHLTESRPNVIKAFFDFLDGDAGSADKVYLLGDLFEFWIGDDAAPLLGAEVILQKMSTLAAKTQCCFIAGNRDFLVGDQFEAESGFTILDDESVLDIYGTPTLLLHGDSLCSEDIAHQQFRELIVNNKEWRDQFLTLSIPDRIEQAKQARMQSNEHKTSVSMEIMDVTEDSVIRAFEEHNVHRMIHGHTHRQNTHTYKTKSGDAKRYVLGDWSDTSSIMKITKDEITITNQSI